MSVKKIMTILLTALMLFGSIFTNLSLALQSSTEPNDVVSASKIPSYSVTTTPATATPSIICDTKPPQKGEVYLAVDKTTALVGDIITAKLGIKGFDSVAGYQVCMKYDPKVLMPVYNDGTPYGKTSPPESGKLLQERYSPVDYVSNDIQNGYLIFGRNYMNLEGYRESGVAENEGSLAIIRFKVLDASLIKISIVDTPTMTNAVDGTMVFDWYANQLSEYKVTQAPEISSFHVPPPTRPAKPEVYLSVDRTTADAGDIITATLNIKGFTDGVAGYQASIKYDPEVLVPVYADGTLYDDKSTAEDGRLLQYRFNPVNLASNDLVNGILTFAKGYLNMPEYRNSGIIESDGSLAVIRFKVLKAAPVSITMENGPTSIDAISGTMIYSRNNLMINDYVVIQAPVINSHLVKPTPTPNFETKDAGVYLLLDKTTASVGDIINATVYADGFDSIGGYQATVKYNPSVLQPVYSDGSLYDNNSVPENGTLLQNKRFAPTDLASNDLSGGILTFGRAYMDMKKYRESGLAENKGSLAVIRFKVLKAAFTEITLENTLGIPNTVSGTMMFDWNSKQIKQYKVINQPVITIQTPTVPSPTITINPTPTISTPIIPIPTITIEPRPTPTKELNKGTVYLTIDKTDAKVGDIIKATVSVKGFECIAAYQANIKYDPAMLQPVYSDGTPYDNATAPEVGTLLCKRYNPVDMAANDLNNGILNFGRAYMAMSKYRSSGLPEKEGSLAVIGFKVLKAGKTNIQLENTSIMKKAICGTLLFDWDGCQLAGYQVIPIQTVTISDGTATPTSTPTPTYTPTPTSTSTPTPTPTPPVQTSNRGEISLTFDKTDAKVGDVIKATLNVKDFVSIAGYQVCIKYDPAVLQPIYEDGTPYEKYSVPENGDLLQKKFSYTDMAEHDLKNGILLFGRAYMNLSAYKNSGKPETTGTLAIIRFKVLKAEPAKVFFYESPALTNSVEGTMIFDWDGYELANYKVIPVQTINISDGATTPTYIPTPTSTPIPTPTPTETSSKGEISLTLDKTNAKVGDVIKATVYVKDFDCIAGYQVGIKYDPAVLQPIYEDGTPYDRGSVPENGDLLQKRFSFTDMADNDSKNGILCFGRSYMNLSAYKNSGIPETTGTLGTICFKVLKNEPAKVFFYESPAMPDSVEGTLIFDWDAVQVKGYKVVQQKEVIPKGTVKMSFDREKVKLGDLVKATISIEDIDNFAAFQFNIRFDKNYIQPWDIASNSPYEKGTLPDLDAILTNEKYKPLSIAANDIENGVLNFAKGYLNLVNYKPDGITSGEIVIYFKAIDKIPEEGTKLAWFEHSDTISNGVNGTLIFPAGINPLTSDYYEVISPEIVYPDDEQSIFVLGDVDGDGKVNSDDYAYMRQYLLGIIEEFPSPEYGYKAADVDGDGNVDSDDYAYMRRWLIGMIDKFPAEEK